MELWSITPGGAVAMAATDNLGDNIYLAPFNGGMPRAVTAERGVTEYPVWSTDGKRMLYIKSRGSVGGAENASGHRADESCGEIGMVATHECSGHTFSVATHV